MLKNDRQLAGAQKKLVSLQEALAREVDPEGVESLSQLIDDAQRNITDYISARAGANKSFAVRSLDDLGAAVVRARVAAGMTQKDLADRLEVSEQQVNKDEAREYETAGVAKVAEALDALGYELVGEVRPMVRATSAGDVRPCGPIIATLGVARQPVAFEVAQWAHVNPLLSLDAGGISRFASRGGSSHSGGFINVVPQDA